MLEAPVDGTDIGRVVDRARSALIGLQRADGAFVVTPNPARPPVLILDPIFSTPSVLEACPGQLPAKVREAAIDYIERRRRRDGMWEWSGCPADADDTALCMATLLHAGRAGDADTLRRFWRVPGGPFQTWKPGVTFTVPDDPVVNCNVLYCLRLTGRLEPQEEQAVADLVTSSLTRTHFSEYYWSLTTLAYAAARAGLSHEIVSAVGRAALAQGVTNQGVAELLVALPEQAPRFLRQLLEAQRLDGCWTGEPWFFDVVGDFCSDSYATAVAMEALLACLAHREEEPTR